MNIFKSFIPFTTFFGVSNSFFGIALTDDVSHSPLTFKISAHLTRPERPSCDTETYNNHLKLNNTSRMNFKITSPLYMYDNMACISQNRISFGRHITGIIFVSSRNLFLNMFEKYSEQESRTIL